MRGLFAAIVTLIVVVMITIPCLLLLGQAASGVIAAVAIAVMGGFLVNAIERNGKNKNENGEDE